MRESPKIEVYIVQSNESPGGIGELAFPSVSPALCNAIYDSRKVRIRRLPIKHTSLITNISEDDLISQSKINIYPIPFEDFVNIDFDISNDEFGNSQYSIFDILGNKVFSIEKEYYQNKIKEQLNLGQLVPGAYSLTIKLAKDKVFVKKLIK